MIEPVTTLSTLSSSLTATVTAANFLFALHNTPKDVRACAQLVTRVYDDLQYLVILRNSHDEYLNTSPVERQRVDSIISEATKSLLVIGSKLEACRADANGGKVPLMGRMKWVLGDSASFVLHSRNLGVQQAAINTEIGWLRTLNRMSMEKDNKRDNRRDKEDGFENLELLRMGSKKSMVFREKDHGGLSAPPPYEENATRLSGYEGGLSNGQARLEKTGSWNTYLQPAREAYCQSLRPESQPSLEYGRHEALPSRMSENQWISPILGGDGYGQLSSELGSEIGTSLAPKSTITRQRSFSNFELMSKSQYQMQPHISASAGPPFFDQDQSNVPNLPRQTPYQHQILPGISSSPALPSSEASALFTTAPYKSFNPLSQDVVERTPPPRPPRPPRHSNAVPHKQHGKPLVEFADTVTKFPDSRPSELHGDSQWSPTPEISFQVPYMPVSTPVPNSDPAKGPLWSDEKIAFSYTPFSYRTGPYTDQLPEVVDPTTSTSERLAGDEVEKECGVQQFYDTTPVSASADKAEKECISYAPYSPMQAMSQTARSNNTTTSAERHAPTPILSPPSQIGKANTSYTAYAPTPTMSPFDQAENESNTYSTYVPTPITSPISFADRQNMSDFSFMEVPNRSQYSRDMSTNTLRKEEDPTFEDAEDSFFRDLKIQEIEKRRRLGAG